VAGIVVLAFNLRGSITSLPPLFPELSSSLHLSSAAIAAHAATGKNVSCWWPWRCSVPAC
jgi:hypothetical protein